MTFEELVAQVFEVRSAVSSLARQSGTAPSSGRRVVRRERVSEAAAAGPGFVRFAPDDEVLLASGTGAETGRIDLTAEIPGTASYAYVRFRVRIQRDTEYGDIQVRPGTSGTLTTVVDAGPGESSGDGVVNTNSEWVRLDAGAFDYEVNVAVTPEWDMTLLGYA